LHRETSRIGGMSALRTLLVFGIGLAFLFTSSLTGAYVLPCSQILEFMSENFDRFESLVVVQQRYLSMPERSGPDVIMKEKLILKPPKFYRLERLESLTGDSKKTTGREPKAQSPAEPFTGAESEPGDAYDLLPYRLLLAPGAEKTGRLLQRLGIDLDRIALDRLEETIVYRVGAEDPESPKLLIEKERFLPLLLIYRVPAGSRSSKVTLQYRDYRKLEVGWYPYEITAVSTEGARKTFFAEKVDPNREVDLPLEVIPEVRGFHSGAKRRLYGDKDRIREVVDLLEKNYR